MAKKELQPNRLPELKKAIREKQPDRLYFFHGEEVFLLHHYLEQLRKILVDPLTESFNYHRLNQETFDLTSFADAVENLPMMSEFTFVWVDEVDIFKLNEEDRNRLQEIFNDIPPYCTVVFTYETTPWKPDKRYKKLWDAVENNGVTVEFAKQDPRELISWIIRHFHAQDKQISQELCAYLIELTGGTMTALAGEISKICAYSGAQAITKSDIDAVTEPVLEVVVFQMTDLIGAGDYSAALLKLHQLMKQQEDPLGVLGAIGAHFRRLGIAKTLLDNGRSAADMARLTGLPEYAARRNMNSAHKFPARLYSKAAELIMETDVKIKTSYDEPERLLELLVLQLAPEARNV